MPETDDAASSEVTMLDMEEADRYAQELVGEVLAQSSDVGWSMEHSALQSEQLRQDLREICLTDFLQEEICSTLRDTFRKMLDSHMSSRRADEEQVAVDALDAQPEASDLYTFVLVDSCDHERAVRCRKDAEWSDFLKMCKLATGMEISHIKYDDDFGPKQQSDIVCAGEEDWQELLQMMEEDADEVKGMLRVVVYEMYRSELTSVRLRKEEERLLMSIRATWAYPTRQEVKAVSHIQRWLQSHPVRSSYTSWLTAARSSAHTLTSCIKARSLCLHFRHRRHAASLVIARSYKTHRARLALIGSRMIAETVVAWCTSIAEEQNAYRRDWIISQAVPAAQQLEAAIRRQAAPTVIEVREREKEREKASAALQALLRCHLLLRAKLAKDMSSRIAHDMLADKCMKGALHVLVYENSVKLLQSACRRHKVQKTLAGKVTSLSADIAVEFAFQQVMDMLIHADQTYEASLRSSASQILSDAIKRLSVWARRREMLRAQWQLKRWFSTLNLAKRYRELVEAAASLQRVIRSRSRHREFFSFCHQASKIQRMFRRQRLVLLTFKSRDVIGRLMAVLRSSLHRRFYSHVLLIGKDLTHGGNLLAHARRSRDLVALMLPEATDVESLTSMQPLRPQFIFDSSTFILQLLLAERGVVMSSSSLFDPRREEEEEKHRRFVRAWLVSNQEAVVSHGNSVLILHLFLSQVLNPSWSRVQGLAVVVAYHLQQLAMLMYTFSHVALGCTRQDEIRTHDYRATALHLHSTDSYFPCQFSPSIDDLAHTIFQQWLASLSSEYLRHVVAVKDDLTAYAELETDLLLQLLLCAKNHPSLSPVLSHLAFTDRLSDVRSPSRFLEFHTIVKEATGDLKGLALPYLNRIYSIGLLGARSIRRRRGHVSLWSAMAAEVMLTRCVMNDLEAARSTGSLLKPLFFLRTLSSFPGRPVMFLSMHVDTTLLQILHDDVSSPTRAGVLSTIAVLSSDSFFCASASMSLIDRLADLASVVTDDNQRDSVLLSLFNAGARRREVLQQLLHRRGFVDTVISLLEGGERVLWPLTAKLVTLLARESDGGLSPSQTQQILTCLSAKLVHSDDLTSDAVTAARVVCKSPAALQQLRADSQVMSYVLNMLQGPREDLFYACAKLLRLMLLDERTCTTTLQQTSFLNLLYQRSTRRDVKMRRAVLKLLRSIALAFETSLASLSSGEQTDVSVDNLMQVKHFTSNSMWLESVFNIVQDDVTNRLLALSFLKTLMQLSPESSLFLLDLQHKLPALIASLSDSDVNTCQVAAWCVYYMTKETVVAELLLARGLYTRLKVLLYSASPPSLRVAVLHCLRPLVVGVGRRCDPDEELVTFLAGLLGINDEELRRVTAELLSEMIVQDYIELQVSLDRGKCLPQSDNWGLCDPFLKLSINGQQRVSPVVRNSLHPVWNFSSTFRISDKSDELLLELFDWDMVGEEKLGCLRLSCETLELHGTEEGRVKLTRMTQQQLQRLEKELQALQAGLISPSVSHETSDMTGGTKRSPQERAREQRNGRTSRQELGKRSGEGLTPQAISVKDEESDVNSVRRAALGRKRTLQDEARRLVELEQGWFELEDEEGARLEGFEGEVLGFDDKGVIQGKLRRAATRLRLNMQYEVLVNVDRTLFRTPRFLPRVLTLLRHASDSKLATCLLKVLRAMTEDVPESVEEMIKHAGMLDLLQEGLEQGGGGDMRVLEVMRLLNRFCEDEAFSLKVCARAMLMEMLEEQHKSSWEEVASLSKAVMKKIQKHMQEHHRKQRGKKMTN